MSSSPILSDAMDAMSDAASSHGDMSSPQLPSHTSPRRRVPRKARGQPSITPRRFSRFFDARRMSSMSSPSGRALKALVNNHQLTQSSPPRSSKSREVQEQENEYLPSPREFKRKKRSSSDLNIENGSIKRSRGKEPGSSSDLSFSDLKVSKVEDNVSGDEAPQPPKPIMRIASFENRGLSARLLQSSLGTTRSRQANLKCAVNDWRDETASFYSVPEDIQHSLNTRGDRDSIPFCNTGFHTSSLVAIGDDEGRIRLVESEKNDQSSFSNTFLGWQIHNNAIIDVALSDDDALLATASGDQCAKVTDMVTQTTISILSGHTATLKQVKFQPGANNRNIVATSSRDGCVQLWDLRCKGDEQAVLAFQKLPEQANPPRVSASINSILEAHHPTRKPYPQLTADGPGRSGVSVTAIHFLPPGREHLLLTASEADCVVKLWDVRNPLSRRKNAQPVTCTTPPPSHIGHRPFGLTSITMSSDGSRFYSVCKDSVVYAYSTSHLTLGYTSNLDHGTTGKRVIKQPTREGPGPLYGFRHPSLHVSTFYIKSALRKAANGHTELLAVGSNDGTPILFPSDERYLGTKANTSILSGAFGSQKSSRSFSSNTPPRSGGELQSSIFDKTKSSSPEDAIPIYTHGTALVRGHGREVSAVSWTRDGELVCADDDWNVRCWREGERARDLRMGGESEGRRWRCGWAEIEDEYDNAE